MPLDNWTILLIILVALTSSAVGYAIASLLLPMVANVITQVLVVFILMFSPLNFPAERLPDWLAAVHRVLPIQAMGELIRGTVAGGPQFPIDGGNLLLLAAWAAGALAASWYVMERRG